DYGDTNYDDGSSEGVDDGREGGAGLPGSRKGRLHFRVSGRGDAASVRRDLRSSDSPCAGSPRTERVFRGGGVCAGDRKSGRVSGHFGSGRDQSGDRPSRRDDGFDSGGRDHG